MANTVHGGRVSPVFDQRPKYLVFVVQHAQVHGRLAVRVPGVRVGTAVQQQPDDAPVAGPGGHVNGIVGRPPGGTLDQEPVPGHGSFHGVVVAPLDRLPELRGGRRPFSVMEHVHFHSVWLQIPTTTAVRVRCFWLIIVYGKIRVFHVPNTFC